VETPRRDGLLRLADGHTGRARDALARACDGWDQPPWVVGRRLAPAVRPRRRPDPHRERARGGPARRDRSHQPADRPRNCPSLPRPSPPISSTSSRSSTPHAERRSPRGRSSAPAGPG